MATWGPDSSILIQAFGVARRLALTAAVREWVIRANDGWAIAARESLEVPKVHDPPPPLVGVRFDALDNPFVTTLKLWTLGYVLDHLCERERPEARLFTPVIDAAQHLPT